MFADRPRIIEVESGQGVVSTGPYAVVRRSMYATDTDRAGNTGGAWLVVGPDPGGCLFAVMTARIRNEERVLVDELGGYR